MLNHNVAPLTEMKQPRRFSTEQRKGVRGYFSEGVDLPRTVGDLMGGKSVKIKTDRQREWVLMNEKMRHYE